MMAAYDGDEKNKRQDVEGRGAFFITCEDRASTEEEAVSVKGAY